MLDKGTRYVASRRQYKLLIFQNSASRTFDRLEAGPFPNQIRVGDLADYQSAERTLTDNEVEGTDERIVDSLRQRLGAELRQ
jgi:hypothetical protein